MSISIEDVVKRLTSLFPNKIIFKEEYSPKLVGLACDHAIYKAAKADGCSRVQWLRNHGFDWRETGYIEQDMRPLDILIDRKSAASLSESVIKKYPLAGQYEPTDEEMALLKTEAQKVFNKMTWEKVTLSPSEQSVLTFYTVQLLKIRSSDDMTESGDKSFWNYIYLQYGFKQEDSEVAASRIYFRFCDAIKKTFSGSRFMATDGHLYYTTMLLHAIAPKQSIWNLYEVLFQFYTENLNFQYEPNDPIYDAFVKGMQRRWDSDTENAASLQLRSDVVMVGLKTLFQNRPGYMAKVCDTLVRNIDRLVRGESWDVENRWDRLLVEWFQEKTLAEQAEIRSKKKQHRTEFVATSAERIYVRYTMEKGSIGLQIPQIRLPKAEVGNRPRLRLFQDDNEIYSEEMSVAGNELGLTTRSIFLPLEDTHLNFSEALKLCAKIDFAGELYSSGSKLFREYILFDGFGAEKDIRRGIAFLFTDGQAEVDFNDDEDVYLPNHPGQLFRFDLEQVGAITVNGREIFADEKQTGKIRMYPSIRPLRNIEASFEGKKILVFDSDFEISLHIPENENRLRYRAFLDDKPIEERLDRETDNECIYNALDTSNGLPHFFRVFDLKQSAYVLEFAFVVLPAFSYETDKEYYFESEYAAELRIFDSNDVETIPMVRFEDSDIAVTTSQYRNLSFEVTLPVIHAHIGESNLFDLPEMVWYESIEKSDFVRLSLPEGWKGKLQLGSYFIEPNYSGDIELGNYLQSGRRFESKEQLKLCLWSDSERKEYKLSELVFTPIFLKSPIYAERGYVNWIPEGSFFGPTGTKFHVSVSGKKNFSFEAGMKNCGVKHLEDNCQGVFYYTVSMDTTTLFSKKKETVLYSGEFFHGNKNELRFLGKELCLTSAIYWNIKGDCLEISELRSGAGIVSKMKYVRDSIPYEGSEMLPEYVATLYFETADGKRVSFSSDEKNDRFECINPVSIWIVNGQRLILYTVDDESVYFDTKTNTIISRNPELGMSKEERYERLQNPDYFDYLIKE